jgi:predicted deacetylase
MKFVIRDDDLNYFSAPADVDRWYSDIFAAGIPVSFAVIPFVTPHADVYTRADAPYREYAVSENTELVSYLNNQSLAHIMLHGCTHETVDGIFEYQKISGLTKDTLRGKAELETSFGPISVFVPPHDQISNHGLQSLEVAGLNLIRSKGSKNILVRFSSLVVAFKMLLHRLRFITKPRTLIPAYPHVVSLGRHQEAFAVRIESGTERLIGWLRYAYEHDGDFVVTMHIHDMTEEKKETLRTLIKEAKRLGAQFVPATELFS